MQKLTVYFEVLIGDVEIVELELELGQLEGQHFEYGEGKGNFHAAEAFHFEFVLGVYEIDTQKKTGNFTQTL